MVKKKQVKTFVGMSLCDKHIVNGALVFQLVDTYGLPFTLVNDILREKNYGFDVFEFIRAAKASKNFSMKRCQLTLTQHLEYDSELYNMTNAIILYAYK